jgi:fucose permease
LLGLVALNRLLHRFSARLLLGVACGGSIVLLSCWLSSSTIVESTLWLFLVGIVISWHYPLVQAQAYRAAEGHSGQVVVLEPLASVLELASPIALGLVADCGGLTLSLVALLAQPVGLLLLLHRGTRRRRSLSSRDG